jgi:hypothetical protein
VSDEYLWDRSGPPDPEVVRLERLLGGLEQRMPSPALTVLAAVPRRRPSRAFALVFAAAAIVIGALVAATWIDRGHEPAGWEVTRLDGTPEIAARPVADRATLGTGDWLRTGDGDRAAIAVGDIGEVQVDPGTSLRLLSARSGDYRLHLERGTVHALIWSPPGQFFVETPSSTAVDLGCAYTMTVDAAGVGTVRVTSGWVGFEWQGREAFIPAGAVCLTRPGRGPGTPHYERQEDGFDAALDLIDTGAGSRSDRAAALTRVLEAAGPRDTVTLWHLLSRVDIGERDRVFDRLAAFVPPPEGVTQEGIRAGQRDELDRWWDALGLGTASWWRTWKQQWRDQK